MREVEIVLLGAGGVGRALLRQLGENRLIYLRDYHLKLRPTILCDSTGMYEVRQDEDIETVVAWKEQGRKISEMERALPLPGLSALAHTYGRPGTVFVDCTASSRTAEPLLYVLGAGGGVVLANKKPLTLDKGVFDRFRGRRRPTPRCRWEATVGAALPVMVTLERLESCGDHVTRVAGTLSGTLGFLMSGLEEGRAFSELVLEARSSGYTEPDPREDLGGMDVARKALILARMLGWELELSDVQVEKLYPEALDSVSEEDFREQLTSLDSKYFYKNRIARNQGKVLRYTVEVAHGRCRVGLADVPEESPLGRLKGVNQLVEIYSRWYDPDPLVIQGRGAGVDATASAVLSDIVQVAQYHADRPSHSRVD